MQMDFSCPQNEAFTSAKDKTLESEVYQPHTTMWSHVKLDVLSVNPMGSHISEIHSRFA